jgi:hypothetical protein
MRKVKEEILPVVSPAWIKVPATPAVQTTAETSKPDTVTTTAAARTLPASIDRFFFIKSLEAMKDQLLKGTYEVEVEEVVSGEEDGED